ncbi:MAG TPA: NAD(P)H-binding protein [Candidatus Solibacter sp.]|nr:NAD(P)H-binding protein [Candidatus Solibacter sp.]
MYAILGATGNTGSVIAERLLDNKQHVRVIGRDKARLSRLTSLGAEPFVADVTDSALLLKAFQGARAVYALIPPIMTSPDYRAYQDQVTNSIVTAIESARVSHVVALSSIGADKSDKTGPVVGLHILEQRLARIPKLNFLNLRAGYFMENTLSQAGIIKNLGKMAGPVRADLGLPVIATHDIGVAAADALLKLEFTGQQTQELHGQRDLSYLEMAKIVGAAIGKHDLSYVQLPAEQVIQALTGMGMSNNLATLLCEMSDALNNGYMRPLEPRSAKNTTPTSYEEFVRTVFVPAYKGQAAKA